MPFRYRIERDRGLFFTEMWGAATAEETRAYLTEIAADPDYEPHFDGLIELRDIEGTLKADELRSLAELARVGSAVRRPRRALVVETDLHFGLMRMFEAYTGDGPREYRVFRKREEALVWIERRDEEGPTVP